jgi:hypothetical protein
MRRFMQTSTAFLHHARTILCFGGENEWPRKKDNFVIVLKPGGLKQPSFESAGTRIRKSKQNKSSVHCTRPYRIGKTS